MTGEAGVHATATLDEVAARAALLQAKAEAETARSAEHEALAKRRAAAEAELKTLGDAANEAAKREAAQWFFFVTVMITLAALIGSTTHRMLLLREPVKVPLLSVELPLLSFYWAAPPLFVVLHFYLLAQVQMMAGKVHAFLDLAMEAAAGDGEALRTQTLRLDPFSVAQVLAARRLGDRARALHAMVWVSLAVAPAALLLFGLLRFLPYHDPYVTLWHWALLCLDAGLIVLLWPLRLSAPPTPPAGPASAWRRGVAATAEPWLRCWPAAGRGRVRVRWMARLVSVGALGLGWLALEVQASVPLVLRDEVLIGAEELKLFQADERKALAGIRRTTPLVGRDLRGADLTRADLRRADLTGALLQGALLDWAQLQGATLHQAKMQGARLVGANLQDAFLKEAQLQGAWLSWARLQGATLDQAEMQGARLIETQLQGASLDRAQLQGALLAGAQLQGAWLGAAQLQGAWLGAAQQQNGTLAGAQLQGAWLGAERVQDVRRVGATQIPRVQPVGAQLQGAWFGEAQDKSVPGAQLQGAHLDGGQAWRSRAHGANLDNASLLVGFGEDPPCTAQPPNPREACKRVRSWPEWVDAWLASMPNETFREPFRENARSRLAILLARAADDPPEVATTRATWEAAPAPDAGRVAAALGDLACAADNAPFVARGVLWQIWSLPPGGRDLREHRASLADRLRKEDCVGARGLSESERARLAAIAAGRN